MQGDIYNNHTYLTNNPTWHEEDAGFKATKILQLLERNGLKYTTACEVGCGSGEILVQMASKTDNAIQYLGVDISEDAIRIAKAKEVNNIHFELKDITVASNTDSFDLLMVIDVIEHIENYFDFIQSINSKAKYTVFHIPLDMCLWTLLREQMLIESKERVGHIHNFTEDFVCSILKDKGFTIIDKLYTEPRTTPITFKEKMVTSARNLLFKIHPKFCTKTIGGYSIMVLAKN